MNIKSIFTRSILSVMIVAAALFVLPGTVKSADIYPTDVVFPVGSVATTCTDAIVSVRVENVTNLTAYHLEIDFTPGDVDIVSVANGGVIPDGLFETPTIDDTNGVIIFGMARQGYETLPKTGSGVLIDIRLRALNPGVAVPFTIRPYVPPADPEVPPTAGEGSMLVSWDDVSLINFDIVDGSVITQSCPPSNITLSNNSIDENLPVNTRVGYLATQDPDGPTGFVYTLVDSQTYPDNVYFKISGDELQTNAVFSYEALTTYTVKVQSTYTDNLGSQSITKTFVISVTDANDPPVLGSIGAQSVNEGELLTFTAIATDEDLLPAPDELTYSLAAGASGSIPSGASIVASTGVFTWTPTEAQGPGSYTFDVCVSDGLVSDCETITVSVNEVNAAPVLGAIGPQSVNEQELLNFTATATDTDLPTNPKTFSLVGAPANAVINASLGAFSWTPTEAQGPGSYTFDVCVSDGLVSDCETITVPVNEVNAAPSGTDKTVITSEDTGYPFTAADFGFTDPDDVPVNTLLAVKITTLPAAGMLKLDGVPVTAGQMVSAVNIGAGKLVFSPAANANGSGYASFTFQVQDNGGTNPGVDLDPVAKTMTINVTPVNDAPQGADKTITINEDTPYTLLAGDFGFSDPLDLPAANAFAGVRITSLPTAGTLKLSGINVTIGQVIPLASLPNLVFTPATNANGIAYSNFTFQVQDNGSGVAPNVNLDPSPNTITFNVTPVNDAPVGVGDHYYLNSHMKLAEPPNTYLLEVNTPGVLANDSDIDGGTLTAVRLSGPTSGVLDLKTDGSFTYTYTAGLTVSADSFVYTLSDGFLSVDVTVNITIDLVPLTVVAQWLEPITAPAGAYYGTLSITGTTETVPLKVFVADTTGVARVEFRWFDHTVSPGVWHVIGADTTPTLENGKQVYTSALDLTPLPYTNEIQVWAWTYDAAGNHTGTGQVGVYDYWSRFMVTHNPPVSNIYLPVILR